MCTRIQKSFIVSELVGWSNLRVLMGSGFENGNTFILKILIINN